MSEESIGNYENYQRRLRRAKERAKSVLRKTGYTIIPSDNSVFCILGVRSKEIRLIRVVIDEITNNDYEIVNGFEKRPGVCTREIWLKRKNCSDFIIQEVNLKER